MVTLPSKKRETGALAEVWIYCNQLLEAIRSARVMPSGNQGVRVSQTPNGTLLVVDSPNSSSTSGATQFRVKQVMADYLVCREFDGSAETGDDVNVAKPFELRESGWIGQSVSYALESILGGGTRTINYQRLGTDYRSANWTGGNTEYQAIRPQYLINKSVIFAIQPSNGTGVDGCDWVEIDSGRAFAKIA